MPTTFRLVTDTDVAAEQLFDISVSIDAHLASMAGSGETAIAGVTSGRIGLDETVTWRARHFGVWFTMTSRITALERPHRFVDEQVRGPFRSFRHEHTFSRAGDRTRMTDTLTVGSPVLGALVERVILVPYLRLLIRRRNEHLLESLGSPLAPEDSDGSAAAQSPRTPVWCCQVCREAWSASIRRSESAMRVLILTFGTRGDIDPFAALAERLSASGHTAVLAAPEPYRDVVSSAVRFEPMATEMDRVMRAGIADLGGPAQALTLARHMSAAMRVSLQEQWDVAQRVDPTIIVSHPKALGGLHIAERLGVPFVASLPLPFLTPTVAFPVPFLARSFSAGMNRFTYQFNRFTAVAYGGMVNRFRRERLGLRRMSRFSDYLTTRDGRPAPVLYPFSRHVVPVPDDYPASAHVCGYWFPQRASTWEPPEELVAFLECDRPVIYVGFGSMGFGANAADRGRVVLHALRQAGVRAVVATGWGGLTAESTDDIMVVKEAPHEWLFPRVSAVVHHGGSGTTASGLRAGQPTLVCPILGDQPFWGRRVHELGAGPSPLPLRRATAASLSDRILDLVSHQRYADRAAAISEQIASEDGTGRAVDVLEEIEVAHHRAR